MPQTWSRPVHRSTPQVGREAYAHPGVGEGLDPARLLTSLGFVALGLGAAALGLFSDVGVRLGSVPVPLSLAGPVLAVGGAVVGYLSFGQKTCLHCNRPLVPVTAWFPVENEADVLLAVNAAPADLGELAMGHPAEESVRVKLEYCAGCEAVGVLAVAAFRPRPQALVERVVTGGLLTSLIAVVRVRDDAHAAQH